MSIFDRMKKKRETDMAAGGTPPQVQPQQPQPVQQQQVQHTQTQQVPTYVPPPPKGLPSYPDRPTMIEKIATQEIQEEVMTITDEEKREFVLIFEEKYKVLNKEMQQILSKIEDAKLREKQKYEEQYRNQLKVIDDHYEQQKRVVEARYLPHMERFKALSDKFREHIPNYNLGGIQNETKPWSQEGWKPQPVREPQPFNTKRVPGPEIDETYLNKENSYDPEISELLRRLDSTKPGTGYPPRI